MSRIITTQSERMNDYSSMFSLSNQNLVSMLTFTSRSNSSFTDYFLFFLNFNFKISPRIAVLGIDRTSMQSPSSSCKRTERASSVQHHPCDDRFHTPRASASSSRSQNSNASSFATARDALPSARSVSSSGSELYQTPRSPAPDVSISERNRVASHDRTRDFRRFTDRGSRPASSLATSRHNSDNTSSTAAAAAAANRHRENDPQKKEPDQNIFSLARHGRAGEVEASLLAGFPADARDEFGNSLLIVGCQVRRRWLFSSISFALPLALPLNFPAI